jgi:hypothetical protein
MTLRIHVAALACAIGFGSMGSLAAAGERASFITGTYVMAGKCEKLAKLAAGTSRSVMTVPETLTADGFEGWEGGCSFISIKEKSKGRVWVATMACHEAADEWQETDTFELDPKDQSLTVTVDKKTSRFVRCDAEKGK